MSMRGNMTIDKKLDQLRKLLIDLRHDGLDVKLGIMYGGGSASELVILINDIDYKNNKFILKNIKDESIGE